MDAALTLFVEYGFHGTAVPLIAKQAGVGAGTIYRYFDSKETLVNALYRRLKADMLQEVMVGFPYEAGAREQFRAFWQSKARYARTHPDAMHFVELAHHAHYLDAESLALEARGVALVRTILQAWQHAGAVISGDPDTLAALVFGAFWGLLRLCRSHAVIMNDALVSFTEERAWNCIAST